MQILIHGCKNFRVNHQYKSNANSITLEVCHRDEALQLTLFDLSPEITDKLVAHFSDDRTTNYDDVQEKEDPKGWDKVYGEGASVVPDLVRP